VHVESVKLNVHERLNRPNLSGDKVGRFYRLLKSADSNAHIAM